MDITKSYKNGQKIAEQLGDTRVVYHENGNIKAKGPFINGKMQGRWEFHKKSGDFWQEASFKDDLKHGEWKRYDGDGRIIYHAWFELGKLIEKIK